MPDLTSTLLAMYQQIIGGSLAREQASCEAEAARRVIVSGMNIASNGAMFVNTLAISTLSATSLSVTGALTVGGLATISGGLVVAGGFQVNSGGAVIIGNLNVSGTVTAGAGTHVFAGAGNTTLGVQNTTAATNAFAALNVGNDATNGLASLQAFSSLWPAVANQIAQPNGVALQATGTGGLSVTTGAAALRLYTNGALRFTINAGGFFTFNPGPGLTALNANYAMACDLGVVGSGISLQNTNAAAQTGVLIGFFNNAGGFAGSISQQTTTTVAFNTTSDARLKDDRGRATDLSALRGTVVHDFTWKADGRVDRGVFAQEAARLFPRAVTIGTDETTDAGALAQPWMTDYSKFVPDLIAGWQQHDTVLTELRVAIDAVTDRLRGAA